MTSFLNHMKIFSAVVVSVMMLLSTFMDLQGQPDLQASLIADRHRHGHGGHHGGGRDGNRHHTWSNRNNSWNWDLGRYNRGWNGWNGGDSLYYLRYPYYSNYSSYRGYNGYHIRNCFYVNGVYYCVNYGGY